MSPHPDRAPSPLQPTNLLLNRDCELAIADFGLARHLPSDDSDPEMTSKAQRNLTRYVVTRWYRAPELLVQNRAYDAAVDMWSVGCILAEVVGAQALFPGKDSLHQLRLIIEKLGVPTADELERIENPQAVAYVTGLRGKVRTHPDRHVARPHPSSLRLVAASSSRAGYARRRSAARSTTGACSRRNRPT